MNSNTFRLVWSLVVMLLLLALLAVVWLVWDRYPTEVVAVAPSATHSVATRATPQPVIPTTPPAATPPTPPGPSSSVELGSEQRVRAGGFSFRPLPGFAVEIDGGTVLLRADLDDENATQFQLIGTTGQSLAADTATTALDEFTARYSQEQGLTVAAAFSATVDSLPAVGVTLTGDDRTAPSVGRLVLAEPGPDQRFVLAAVAPAAAWSATLPQFDALLASIRFFAPTSASAATSAANAPTGDSSTTTADAAADELPAVGEDAGRPATTVDVDAPPQRRITAPSGPWRSYSNANLANAVTVALNTIWVATDGGVIAWNKNNGSFAKYTTLDGLAANRTTAVVNCPLRGFGIVFGSEAGLQIYDLQSGSWKVLNSSNSGMSFDDISALHCDPDARTLVVGYKQHGLDFFDANGGTWRYIGQNDGLQNNLVEALAVVDGGTTLWVSSGLGISVLDEDGQSAFYDEANSPLETNQIRQIVVGPNNVVWLGAQDALYRVKGDEWEVFDQRTVLASPFPSGALNGLVALEDGTLWVGSSLGEICHFDPVRVQCRDFFAGEPGMVAGELTSLTLGADEAIYYTTAGGGISMYAGGRWRAFAIPDEPLFGNEIHSLAETADGNVWVATERGIQAINPITDVVVLQFTRDDGALSSANKEVLHPGAEGGVWFGAVGVSFFNGLGWTSYTTDDGLAGSLVQAIATDSQGRTWFGTESGLSIWNGSTFFNLTTENGLPNDNIITLLADEELMWIGAAAGGLFRFQKNQLQLYSSENSGLPSGAINAIAMDEDGALLLGHTGGLARFVDGDVTPIPALNGIAVSAIARAADGSLWIGSNGDGLFYYDGEDWTDPPAAIAPPSPQISHIVISDDGSVWVGARTGGLIRYLGDDDTSDLE